MKTLLVTGGSRGIGKAICERFALAGYRVVAPSRLEMDLADVSSVETFIARNQDTAFDVIINNAGINDIHTIEQITDEEIDRAMAINLTSPIRLLRGLVGGMKRRGYGRIVNIGSIWAVVSKAGRCTYSATKNGIHGVTNTLAVELAPDGILVNTVCPGFTLTELTSQNNSPEQIAAICKEIPLGRMAEPSEIAELVYFLGSELNTYLTGQKITVDGGFTEK